MAKRVPYLITIPAELRPDPDASAVLVHEYRAGRVQRVKLAQEIEDLRNQGRLEEAELQGIEARQSLRERKKDRDKATGRDTEVEVDPLTMAFIHHRPHLVVAECLHAVGSAEDAEGLRGATRMSEAERSDWVDDQWNAVVRHIAEDLLRKAGEVSETKELSANLSLTGKADGLLQGREGGQGVPHGADRRFLLPQPGVGAKRGVQDDRRRLHASSAVPDERRDGGRRPARRVGAG